MAVDLAAEFEAPAKIGGGVDLTAEFDPPSRQEQHAIINDAADKAAQWKRADATGRLGMLLEGLGERIGPETKATLTKNWEDINKPMLELPKAPKNVPDVPVFVGGGAMVPLPVLAGAYNGVAPVVDSLSSPLNVGTLGLFGGLQKVAQGIGPAARAAQAGLQLIKGAFAAEMARGAGEAAGKASVSLTSPDATTQEKTEDVVGALTQGALAAVAGHSATVVEPTVSRGAVNPSAVKEALIKQEEINNANQKQSTAQEVRVNAEPPASGGQVAGGKPGEPVALAGESVAKEAPKETSSLEADRAAYENLQRQMQEMGPDKMGTPEFNAVWQASENIKNKYEGMPPGEKVGGELAKEFEVPAPDTPEALKIQETVAKEPTLSGVEAKLPVVEGLDAEAAKASPTAVMNAVVDQERVKRGLPPAIEVEARSDPAAWAEATRRLDENPSASAMLVDELKKEPRAINDVETALIRHQQIELQYRFDRVAEDIIKAQERGDMAEVARLAPERDRLSNDLVDVYDAGKLAGTETARGLRARQVMQNEDFSLAQMVTRRRAVNDGRPLTPEQMAETEALHAKIAELEKQNKDLLESRRSARAPRPVRKAVVEYIGERAKEARARMAQRMAEGRQYSGLDPQDFIDSAIIGADYLARGVDNFATWSESMVKELGEKVKPHLKEIFDKAREEVDGADIEKALLDRKKRLEAAISEKKEKLASVELSPKGEKVSRPSVEEIEKLEQERDSLNKQIAEARKGPEPTPEEKRLSELDSQIQKIETQLKSEAIFPPGKKAQPTSPEIVAAEKRLEELKLEREYRRRGLQPRPEPLTKEEIALKSFKTRTTTRIEDLERRVREGDFTREERIALSKDAEANALQAKLDLAKQEYQAALERDRYNKLSQLGKAREQGIGFYDMARTLMTTGELSFMLRQGLLPAVSHPIRSIRTLPTALKALIANPEAAHALNLEVLNHPDYPAAKAAKLHLLEHGQSLNKQEEILMAAQLAEKIPVVGKAVRGFNQAAEAFLNKLRFDLWRSMRDVGGMTAAEDKNVARYVNQSTGRGTLGPLEQAAVPLGRLMFSPRFFASRIQWLLGESMWDATPRTRRIIAKEYARVLVGLAAFFGALQLRNQFVDEKDKAKIGTDPRSSDFGKVVFRNTRLDPLAGLSQMVVFGARTATGEKTTASGKVVPIRGEKVPYGGERWSDVATNFGRSKLHPVPGAIVNLFNGTDLAGNKVTLLNQSANMAAPLTYMDVYQALEEQDLPEGIALGLLAMLGMGLQTYGKTNKAAPVPMPVPSSITSGQKALRQSIPQAKESK